MVHLTPFRPTLTIRRLRSKALIFWKEKLNWLHLFLIVSICELTLLDWNFETISCVALMVLFCIRVSRQSCKQAD